MTQPSTRILIVDDDVETCRLIEELIAAPGRELCHAYDATMAIGLAREKPFDLVVSDINLNGPDSGLDVLHAFKATNPMAFVAFYERNFDRVAKRRERHNDLARFARRLGEWVRKDPASGGVYGSDRPGQSVAEFHGSILTRIGAQSKA